MTGQPLALPCHHYAAGRCRSCRWLETPYADQLAAKQEHVEGVLLQWRDIDWLPPQPSAVGGFRNKAKLVVTGDADAPVLGIWNPVTGGVDLRDCPLHEEGIARSLPALADFVGRARLTPYDIAARRGELKHLLVTRSPDDELMVRLVLRTTEAVPRVRKHLDRLRADLPQLRVLSVNLQPEPKAIIEGPEEIVLTDRATLAMRLGDRTLHLRPQSFFQTNTAVATALYGRAREWAAQLDPRSLWDLYCGVGGFALHLAGTGRRTTGVEISAEAIASARQSAVEAGVSADFVAGDATAYAAAQDPQDAPDLVVVNPPRRGIGADLAGWLQRSRSPYVLYSSCNVDTLRRDLEAMPALRPVRAQVFDMFPHTAHTEVLALLVRDR